MLHNEINPVSEFGEILPPSLSTCVTAKRKERLKERLEKRLEKRRDT